MLEIHCLSYSYPDQLILDNISFSACPGEVTVVIGLSGSGKTTLFRLIAGLLPHDNKGKILWRGEPLLQQSVAYLQQEGNLLPWRTVRRNILLEQELGGIKQPLLSQEAIQEAIDTFHLQSLIHRFPDELSGGQKQRVALAAQYLSSKPVLLLDEPFSSLDIVTKETLYSDIKSLVRRKNKAAVLVTHDVNDLAFLGDRFFVLKGCQLMEIKVSKEELDLHQLRQQIKQELCFAK